MFPELAEIRISRKLTLSDIAPRRANAAGPAKVEKEAPGAVAVYSEGVLWMLQSVLTNDEVEA